MDTSSYFCFQFLNLKYTGTTNSRPYIGFTIKRESKCETNIVPAGLRTSAL